MTSTRKLALEVIVLTALIAVFGIIFKQNPFNAPSTFLTILAVTLFAGTILSLPSSSVEHSAKAIGLSLIIAVLAIATEMIYPSPDAPSYSEDEMGNNSQAQWQFQLFYQEYGLRSSSIFTFSGTTEESKIALQGTIDKWNLKHPKSPIIDYYRVLTSIPKNYAKKNKYPLTYAGEF